MRYKLYKEHKYISYALNELERTIAKTDFRVSSEVEHIKQELGAVIGMLKGHAHYENERIHELLKKKGSSLYAHVEDDHAHYDKLLAEIEIAFNSISSSEDPVEAGYQFYLLYRKFVGVNLLHLHEEETIILPELQRLYSDDELRMVERDTYEQLTPEEIGQMLQVLFPHMNPTDKEAFFTDIKCLQPEKFNLLSVLLL
jgi:hemerythrin-like domain-containing protein